MGIRKYGTTKDQKILIESQEARDIVSKIMDIGPSQRLILYILHDLGMNLERVEHSRKLTNCCEEIMEDIESGTIRVSEKKIIL